MQGDLPEVPTLHPAVLLLLSLLTGQVHIEADWAPISSLIHSPAPTGPAAEPAAMHAPAADLKTQSAAEPGPATTADEDGAKVPAAGDESQVLLTLWEQRRGTMQSDLSLFCLRHELA
jgi:hypothetical protein